MLKKRSPNQTMPRRLSRITTFLVIPSYATTTLRVLFFAVAASEPSLHVVTSSKQIHFDVTSPPRRTLSSYRLSPASPENLVLLSLKCEPRPTFSQCQAYASLLATMVSTTAPPEQNPDVRITTFCLRRLCLGYKNQNLVPPPTGGPDFYSASVIFGTIVVVMCLLVMLLLVLLETIRLLTRSASPPEVPKTAECMARVYRQVVATCPPTYPTESGTCPVCLEDYQPITFGRKMPCQHFFHIGCIDRWIMRSAARRCQRDVVRCPVCKQPILHEHVEISMEETPLITDHDRRFSDEMHLAENMV